MLRYATTIFLSAFLLFQVQPLIGKLILPWFGGSSAVWTTCMLFFQVVLLCGYAYAHFISSRLSPRAMMFVHLALLAGSLCFLPITPSADAWQTAGSTQPIGRILLLLAGTIGLPYFLLSSTGPLLQESYRRETGLPPYRLYALSNVGSLLALLSYPFVFEPQLRLKTQTACWSIGYAVFVLLSGVCAWKFARLPKLAPPTVEAKVSTGQGRPGFRLLFTWLALSACGSVMLLSTTNQLTQEVPPVPFLWILPLALYLLSFIICFDREAWYQRGIFLPLLLIAIGASGYALIESYKMPLWQQLLIYPGAMFVCCMICHGELVQIRPEPRHATLFYLIVSAGGALGGILVAVGAPLLLPDYWEYQIGLVTTVGTAFVAICFSSDPFDFGWLASGLLFVGIAVLAISSRETPTGNEEKIPVASARNFYGVLRVTDNVNPERLEDRWRLLTNGRINHGFQFREPDKSQQPTSYYTAHSGVGMALDHHPRRFSLDPDQQSLRIGMVGLGTGTIAASARNGDYMLFYEINPIVQEFAKNHFTYTQNSPAKIDVALGDARIQMRRQLADGNPQQFDVLAIDAFSSDAIPVHLLTKESVELYLQHLKPDGLLCIHISNLFLDLASVVRAIARELDIPCVFIDTDYSSDFSSYPSTWAVLTRNTDFLDDPAVDEAVGRASDNFSSESVLWTDDYASLWRVLKKSSYATDDTTNDESQSADEEMDE